MSIRLALILSMLCANSAAALSCAQMSEREVFNYYADAPETYLLALGRFKQAEDGGADHQVQRFSGTRLGLEPLQDSMLEVDVKSIWPERRPDLPQIAGDDRGPPEAGTHLLVFLQLTPEDLIYEERLCIPVAVRDPAPELIEIYRECIGWGRCP